MSIADTVRSLDAFPGRGAGSDAERRAAVWLATAVTRPGREVRTETFWCRPQWALAHAWHLGLALAGSVVMVRHPALGGVLVLLALASLVADAVIGRSPGRWLTPERASQNVHTVPVARSPGGAADGDAPLRARLIITAGYDAGRCGLVHAVPVRRLTARLRRAAGRGRLTPGWLGWLALAAAWLLVVALLRVTETLAAPTDRVLQIPPTLGLLAALAALLQQATAPVGPAAGDPASAVGVAIALVQALDAAPPRGLTVELLLQGAADGSGLGLRHHLRARRRELRAHPTIVLGIGPATSGQACWWRSDGPLIPLPAHRRLRRLLETGSAIFGHRGRGHGPAHPASLAGLPAVSLGVLGSDGIVERSHRLSDRPAAVEPAAGDRLVQAALALVEALDVDVLAAGPSR